MIDLAAVAARIDALPGWHAELFFSDSGLRGVEAWCGNVGHCDIFAAGEVIPGVGDVDVMPLLPVLQIVAEAMSHE